jgi:glutamyl-Q tRNA(Asp) synthetase
MSPLATPLTTRFAPSPTGPLHLGHAYAALVAERAARATGGNFLVRIEDLDAGRARADYEAAIFEDLAWLGLAPDAPAMRQSARGAAYAAAIAKLEAAELVYPCFCTRAEIAAEIAAIGAAPHDDGFGPPYPGTCRHLSASERAQRRAEGRPHVLRLDVQRAIAQARAAGAWPAHFIEAWALGEAPAHIAAAPERIGDIVLMRKDLPASYHLAVIVDDGAQQIGLVTRGEDLLPATHIQVLLQKLLGLQTPLYGHHTLVRDEAGKRLAKRDAARALSHLREQGWDAARVIAALPPLPDFARLAEASAITNCRGR